MLYNGHVNGLWALGFDIPSSGPVSFLDCTTDIAARDALTWTVSLTCGRAQDCDMPTYECMLLVVEKAEIVASKV